MQKFIKKMWANYGRIFSEYMYIQKFRRKELIQFFNAVNESILGTAFIILPVLATLIMFFVKSPAGEMPMAKVFFGIALLLNFLVQLKLLVNLYELRYQETQELVASQLVQV